MSLFGFRTMVRNESTTTTAGLAFSTSFVISSRTAPRSFSRTTWLRLMKPIASGQLGGI